MKQRESFRDMALDETLEWFRHDAEGPRDAPDGEPFTYLPNPELGLWRI